jgi:hypothetical protein
MAELDQAAVKDVDDLGEVVGQTLLAPPVDERRGDVAVPHHLIEGRMSHVGSFLDFATKSNFDMASIFDATVRTEPPVAELDQQPEQSPLEPPEDAPFPYPIDLTLESSNVSLRRNWPLGFRLRRSASQISRRLDPYRAKMRRVMLSKVTEVVVIVAIFTSVVSLTLDVPSTFSNSPTDIIDVVVTALFTIEMLLKLFAFGPRAYFRDSWNRLDALVVGSSWVTFAIGLAAAQSGGSTISLTGLRALRAVRPLRPIRALKFFRGMRTILDALAKSASLLIDVAALIGFILIIFGIAGIQFFQNTMGAYCAYTPPSSTTPVPLSNYNFCDLSDPGGGSCPGTTTCRAVDGNVVDSFKHFGLSILTIFHLMTLDNWWGVMDAVAATEGVVGQLYFIFFIVIVNFLAVQLFVAVITARFRELTRYLNLFYFIWNFIYIFCSI